MVLGRCPCGRPGVGRRSHMHERQPAIIVWRALAVALGLGGGANLIIPTHTLPAKAQHIADKILVDPVRTSGGG